MLDAAIPVLAVTDTTSGFLAYFLRRAVMIAFNSRDLPVPVFAPDMSSEKEMRIYTYASMGDITGRTSEENTPLILDHHC